MIRWAGGEGELFETQYDNAHFASFGTYSPPRNARSSTEALATLVYSSLYSVQIHKAAPPPAQQKTPP